MNCLVVLVVEVLNQALRVVHLQLFACETIAAAVLEARICLETVSAAVLGE